MLYYIKYIYTNLNIFLSLNDRSLPILANWLSVTVKVLTPITPFMCLILTSGLSVVRMIEQGSPEIDPVLTLARIRIHGPGLISHLVTGRRRSAGRRAPRQVPWSTIRLEGPRIMWGVYQLTRHLWETRTNESQTRELYFVQRAPCHCNI